MTLIGARRALFRRGAQAAAGPGLYVKVGSFAKTTAAATAAQAVTGVGFKPKALLLWTAGGQVSGTLGTKATGDARGCVSIVSGTATGEQLAASAEWDTVSLSGARWQTQKAFSMLDAVADGSVASEAVLASFDDDGFTLSWTANKVAEAQLIHFIALGGPTLLAKVQLNDSPTGTGNWSVTGIGFEPNLLITMGAISNGALDTRTAGNASFRVGAAKSSTQRWATGVLCGSGTSGAGARVHHDSRVAVQGSGAALTLEHDFVSFDVDGYTLNKVSGASADKMGVLCLRVPNAAVGIVTKPTGAAPAAAAVSGLGFTPLVVILGSDNDISRANAPQANGGRFGLSAFTAAEAEASVCGQANAPSPYDYFFLDKTGKAALKIDVAPPTLQAEATGALDLDGFTLTWNANDAVATQHGYIALGA